MIDPNGEIRQWSDDAMEIPIVRRKSTYADVQEYVKNGFVRPFDLLSGEPLFRVEFIQTEKGWVELSDGHHCIMDGMSFTPVLFQIDLNKAYMGEELTPQPYGLFEAAEDEVATFGTPVYEKAKAYYAEKFAGMDFATLSKSTPGTMGKMVRRSAFVNQPECDAWCKEHGIAVNLLFQAAFSYVLTVLMRQEKVAYYTVNHGRMDKRLREAYGMFVKSVPIMADATDAKNKTVKDFIMSFRTELMSTIRYGCYPFTHFCSDLKMTAGVSFNFQALVDMEEAIILGDQRIYGSQPVRAEIDDDMTVFIFYKEGQYEIRAESSSAMNDAETLQMMVDATYQALISMQAHLDGTLSEVSILGDEQQAQLIKLSAGKNMDVDITKTFAQAFEERAKLVPDNVAVADKNSHLTYRQLSHYSDVLAHRLITAGVQPNDFVCVMLDRFKEFPLSVLAIHKTGAAYTPMDFEYPNERLQYMLENSESKVLITSHAVLESKKAEGDFETGKVQVIFVEDIDFNVDAEPINLTTPDNLAYMIYTSGSTGKPKGAMLHQAGLWNFINIVIDMEKLTADDRIEGHRSFSFDAHIEDMYAILTLGGSFHIMPTEIRKDLAAIRDFLFEHKITGGGYSTAIGALLLNTYDDLPVRFITAGGEKLDGVYSDHIEIINVYGPTECTDDTSYYSIAPGTRAENIPIGKPVANTWNFIVDSNGRLAPRGVVGELCIAGIQVGRGYWRLPERTAESFVDCPFVSEDRWGRKVRMYHTGDLCRWNKDGDLEYMGRIDFQVKLRGFRIELGEIESKVLQMEGIKQAAAEVRKINGVDHLLLYYTLDNGSAITDDDIRQNLEASSLAEYMVPDTYMQLETMPLTPNGKVNRKALPIPEIQSHTEYVEPANDTERIIAETFKEVLKIDVPVGALNSFFEFGGDSVKAIRLISMLRKKGIVVPVSTVMKEKTVRAIAETIKDVALDIDQSNWSGKVENSAIVQFFFDLSLPVPNHYNQAVMLQTEGRFNKEALDTGLKTVTTHHDMLRAVVKDGALYVREVNDGAMFSVEEFTVDGNDKAAITAIANDIESSIDINNGPLMKLALLHTNEKDYLLIAIHHNVIDGVSWRILIEDLATAYGQAVAGLPASLPAKTHSYKYYQEAMERFKKSYQLEVEKDYWEKVRKEIAETATSAGNDYTRHFIRKETTITADLTDALLAVPTRQENIGMNDLLLTALLRSYAAATGKQKMCVMLEGHGRENIGEPLYTDRTVGWFTSMYPVVLQQDGNDLVANLAGVKDVLHRVPNNGIGYGQLFGMDVASMPQVTFNYLGTFGSTGKDDNPISIAEDMPVGDMVAKANCYGSDITVNCMVLPSGQFSISLDYNEAILTDQQATQLLQGLDTEIKAITNAKINKEDLLTASDLGETTWTHEEFKAVVADFASRGETLKRIYPLTPMQEGMVLRAVMEPDSVAYRIAFALELNVVPTEQQLRCALDGLASRHEVLRTAVILRGVNEYRQAIVDNRQLGLTMKDISGETDQMKAISDMRWDLLKNDFDLQAKPLFNIVSLKTSETSCTLLLVFHHIIEDGWCLSIIQKDFFTLLAQCIEGKPLAAESAGDGRYEQYVREILAKDRRVPLNYWRTLLEGYETKAVIPSFGTISEERRSKKDELIIDITVEEQQMLKNLCTTAQVTPNTIVETAWGLLLQRYNRTDDVVFGKVVSGRDNTNSDVSDLIGLFINNIPVRVRIDKEDTVLEMMKKVQAQAAESNRYDYVALSDIQQQTDLGNELFQSTVVFENYPSETNEATPWPFTVKRVITKEEIFSEISLVGYIGEDWRLALMLQFDNSLFTEKFIADTLSALHQIIHNMLVDTNAKVNSIQLLDEERQEEIMELSVGKHMDINLNETFAELFVRQAKKTPDALAVSDANNELTYREMDEQSDTLAHLLIDKGILPNDFVCVMLDRTKEFPLTVLAIHKAAAAYTPLDLEYPNERLSYMVENSESKVVITTHDVYTAKMAEGGLELGNIRIIYLDELDLSQKTEPVLLTKPEGLAYMIYTSGSTGLPKGVMLHQRGLRSYIASMVDILGITDKDRISNHRPFSFDAHIQDLYPAITVGGSIHIMPTAIRKEMKGLHDFIVSHQITGGSYTTSLGAMLLDSYELPLRYMTLTGEKMIGLVSGKVQLVNGYGPTECTDLISAYHLEKDRIYDDIPIGRPMANSYCFIVDQSNNLVPRGVPGELCFASVQVGRGYWKLPEQTAKVFGDCPFLPLQADGKPLRMYHTGDLCRWNDEDQIMYSGRIDSQVKLRGFRIELGEIETQAQKVEGLQQAVAMVREVLGAQHLILYYTVKEGYTVTDDQIRTFLEQTKLAEYMQPEVYMQLEEFPFNSSGKVNRKALPLPEIKAGEIVPPETDTEKQLWNEVSETLKIKEFGITTPLSHIGMTSLVAMRLAMSIQKKYGVQVPVAELIQEPTVKAIAAKIDDKRRQEEAAMSLFTKRKSEPSGEKKGDPFAAKKADPFAVNKKKNPFD
jgi:amino acid adenylation domain-containing protein/non-ribosomal peptide synthase protein (TIGR01720 family)